MLSCWAVWRKQDLCRRVRSAWARRPRSRPARPVPTMFELSNAHRRARVSAKRRHSVGKVVLPCVRGGGCRCGRVRPRPQPGLSRCSVSSSCVGACLLYTLRRPPASLTARVGRQRRPTPSTDFAGRISRRPTAHPKSIPKQRRQTAQPDSIATQHSVAAQAGSGGRERSTSSCTAIPSARSSPGTNTLSPSATLRWKTTQ